MLKRFSTSQVVKPKTYLLLFLAAYIVCWAGLVGISLFGNHADVIDLETVYEKEISFFHVFSENSKTMLLGALGGMLSFGLISTFLFFYNVISLGSISNALLLGNMPDMVMRMLPHAFIELGALTITAVFPVVLSVYWVRKVKPVICQEATIGQTLLHGLMFGLKNMVLIELLLCLAGIVEYLVSRIHIN